MKKFIGIDISQADFHAAFPSACGKKYEVKTYANTEAGIDDFLSDLHPDWHCILEATGNYSLRLTYQLVESGIALSVLNPKESVHFRKLMGQIWKDDHSDAKLLSLYGQKIQPVLYQLPSQEVRKLKQKRALLRQFKKQKQALQCFLHSLSVHPFADQQVQKDCQRQIDSLGKQIKEMETSISQMISREFEELTQLISSVKSIGPKTSAALIEATDGFRAFDSAKQFSKFIGIAPTYGQSGTSVKMPSRINRSGDPQLRALLYVCSWSAIRYNAACKDLYERLLEKGKPSKVALVAVMNKLIRQVFAVVEKGELFDNEYEQKLKQKQARYSQAQNQKI